MSVEKNDKIRTSILVYRVWWVNWENLVEVEWVFRYDGGMARDVVDIWDEGWTKDGGRRGSEGDGYPKDRKGGRKDDNIPFRRVENISKYIVLAKTEEIGEDDAFVDFDLENELKVLGNLVDKEGVEIHKKEERLESVRKLLKVGVIVEELGVLVDRRSDGNIYDRENSLRDVDKESIVKLLDKIKDKENDNYVLSVLGTKVTERYFEKKDTEESANILVEKIEAEEIKNSLPKSLSSHIEDTEDSLKRGEVTITHVLALDIIQRVIYSDEEISLPVVEGGKVVGWEKKKIESLNILENDTEGHVFNALARHFWKDMVVHGVYDKDGKLRLNSDSDGEVCRYLMNKAGVSIKADENAYKDFNELRPGAVHMDMGQKNGYCVYLEEVGGKTVVTLIIDHHAPDSKSDISASGWVYMGLAKLGLLENPERFAGLVDFLNKIDNGLPPKEVDEIVSDFNSKNGTELTKREYLLQELKNTVWGLKRFITAPKLIEFFEKGRNPLEKLSKRDLSGKEGLGVIFEQGAEYKKENGKKKKVKDGIIVDKQKEFQSHLEHSLNELQKIEKAGFIFESEKYGRIVVDIGGKMMGLGNELSRACGYDGYISWKQEENSFMLTTKKPLEVEFLQGIKVREHMWIKKPEMGGDLKIEIAEILRILNGGKEAPRSNGLMGEQVEIKLNEIKEIIWGDDAWKDLKLAVGYSPERDAAQKRLYHKYGITFNKASGEEKEIQERLISAINVAVTGKTNEIFADVEMAKNELRKYFGGNEVSLNKPAEVKKKDVEANEDQEKDKEREKYLEYLGGEFLEDLKNIYPPFGTNVDSKIYSIAFHRLEETGSLQRIWTKSTKDNFKDNKMRNFKVGQESIRLIEAFFAMDSGYPDDWNDGLMSEMVVGGKLEQFKKDLEEARRLRQVKSNKEADVKSESTMDRKEEMASLARENLDGEDLKKFYRAINVIVSNNATGSEFKTVDEAREFFLLNIKVDLKTEGLTEAKKAEETNDFVLTQEIRKKIKDWVDITRKLRRPNLPNADENLRELTDLGFEVDRADLERVLEALESISFSKDNKEEAERYLVSLFVGGSGEPKEPVAPKKTKPKAIEGVEEAENEKWGKVADLLEKLGSTTKEDRKALYLEIESHGVRIRGTVSDLIDAGATEEDIKNSFSHMANMAKVWKMGEEKARREYPKMVDKYASMARLLRLKWYN